MYVIAANVLGMLAAVCFLVNAIESNEDAVVTGGADCDHWRVFDVQERR